MRPGEQKLQENRMKNNILKTWITSGDLHPFYARKEFTLKSKPVKAAAFVCGLGQFNFYINGRKVGDHVLDPVWADYRKLIYYVKFDITGYLQEGENVFACEVGNGWYAADREVGYFFHFPPFMPDNPNGYRPFDQELVLSLHADLKMPDGGQRELDTDESWLVAEHPVLHTNCFGSEEVDGSRKIFDWKEICAETSGTNSRWKPAKRCADSQNLSALAREQKMPPVRVIRTLEGKYLGCVHGRSIYDFGQNASGMLSFEVRGQSGQIVTAYPAEKRKPDGDVDQMAKNWMLIDVVEKYRISKEHIWENFAMTFTYFGGRYVAIDSPRENLRCVSLRVISSAGENAGEFDCDDERYNQIYRLVERAVEANMLGVHTDCPTIERFAWQEENHLMAPAIMYMKKVKPHWEKFLTDTRLAQLSGEDWFYDGKGGKYYPGDGLIPSQAPCYIPNVLPVPGIGDFYNVIGWGSSIILGTWWHYLFYGDRRIIEDNYESGKKYLAFLKTCVNEDGFINHGLGDWGNPDGEFARENVETAFLYADAMTLKKFAEILGRNTEAEAFAEYGETVRNHYNRRLLVVNPQTGRYCYRVRDDKDKIKLTQAAEAMPLFFRMVPEEYVDDVVWNFRKLLEDAGALRTGEVGQPYIIQTMSEYGMDDLLAEMIVKPQHPSYYAFVLAGETTLGEYWEENPRSHDHDMMGHIIEWYYNGIAGIRPIEPGFRKALIRPYLPRTMNHMKCVYHSASGKISVELTRKRDRIELVTDIPSGIEAVVDRSRLRP